MPEHTDGLYSLLRLPDGNHIVMPSSHKRHAGDGAELITEFPLSYPHAAMINRAFDEERAAHRGLSRGA